jgi:hypothetical protein
MNQSKNAQRRGSSNRAVVATFLRDSGEGGGSATTRLEQGDKEEGCRAGAI